MKLLFCKFTLLIYNIFETNPKLINLNKTLHDLITVKTKLCIIATLKYIYIYMIAITN